MRILFLTHRLPYTPNRGDRIRSYYLLREMSRFADVSLFSLIHDAEELGHVNEVPFVKDLAFARVPRLRNIVQGVAGLATDRPLTHSLLDAPDATCALSRLVQDSPPDVVLAFCSGMARFAMRPPLVDIPCVLDMVDVDSAKWAQYASNSRMPTRWVYRREAVTLSRFETAAVGHARTTLVINERERGTLSALAPAAQIRVVHAGIDLEKFVPAGVPASAPIVIFCGVMNYYPNEEGVRWFARDVWPRVRALRPEARFVIVGSAPTSAVRQLALSDASIEVVGGVPAVQPYLWQAAVSVAPLRLARGLQTKVLESLAAGLPTVVTPAVRDGLPSEALPGCPVAEAPADFAAAVVRLLDATPMERRQHAASAKLNQLTWSIQLRDLESILRQAAVSTSIPATA